jgi:hypothetical protein
MARVGLVWVMAVLGALFMAMSAQGHHHDGGYSLSAAAADTQSTLSVSSDSSPRTAGLALALVVLGGGAAVLLAGATRGDRGLEPAYAAAQDPAPDLTLALGLGLLA